MLVEKRVAGIIRWLERLKKSYSSGALESALMDAECARADLENLRLAVWEKVKPENSSPPKISARISSRLVKFMKPFLLAGIIVMVYVFPISKDVKAPELVSHEELNFSLKGDTLTTQAETLAVKEKQTDILMSTETLTTSKQKLASLPKNETQTSTKKTTIKKNSASISSKRPAANKQSVKEEISRVQANKTVAYDKVFSLVQTGQRALKNNNSVVKVK